MEQPSSGRVESQFSAEVGEDLRIDSLDLEARLVRDRAAVDHSIDDAVNRYLAARPRGSHQASGGRGDD